jgi:heparan-alpha-glucosaminide N-acetyltransferase
MNTLSPESVVPAEPVIPPATSQRLTSVDVYRGFVMFLMMAEVLQLRRVADQLPYSWFWSLLSYHQSHVEWVGCSLHDMIQPSFSFLVGVALPFSLASRLARGQSKTHMIIHAIWRSSLLVFLGIFLRSTNSTITNFTFEDTLSQIGLGYTFLFLLGLFSTRAQWIALAVILIGYWSAFALYPLPSSTFDYHSFGVPDNWRFHPDGFATHWDQNSNLAWAFDRHFLNLFPRKSEFLYNGGGYATLSFIPTLGTMVLGLLAGGVLRRPWSPWSKIGWLALVGILSVFIGWGLGQLGLCPVVKRIWTPSWVLFSGGICFLFLVAFFTVIDVFHLRAWAFPMKVIGMNSIAAYCMADLIEGFIKSNLKTHLGQHAFAFLGSPYEPLLLGGVVLLILWLILFWMYKEKLFLKI